MRRREFIAGLGGTVAWPLAARAQQPTLPVIGYLGAASPDLWADRLRAFRQGLGETGYNEGRTVITAPGTTPAPSPPRQRLRQFRSSSLLRPIRSR
jgi:hypothetical protein